MLYRSVPRDSTPSGAYEQRLKRAKGDTETVALDGKLQSENPRILEAPQRIGGGTWRQQLSDAQRLCLTEMPSFAARSFNACTELTHSTRESKQWQNR